MHIHVSQNEKTQCDLRCFLCAFRNSFIVKKTPCTNNFRWLQEVSNSPSLDQKNGSTKIKTRVCFADLKGRPCFLFLVLLNSFGDGKLNSSERAFNPVEYTSFTRRETVSVHSFQPRGSHKGFCLQSILCYTFNFFQ